VIRFKLGRQECYLEIVEGGLSDDCPGIVSVRKWPEPLLGNTSMYGDPNLVAFLSPHGERLPTPPEGQHWVDIRHLGLLARTLLDEGIFEDTGERYPKHPWYFQHQLWKLVHVG